MGMIRVSDHAEQIIREHTHGRTITATVDAILAGSVAPDGAEMRQQTSDDEITKEYLEAKFDRLEGLIRRAAGDY